MKGVNILRRMWICNYIYYYIGYMASGAEFSFHTPNIKKYTILSSLNISIAEYSITFKVQACHDVHFALINGHSEQDQLYEIVIGGWNGMKSVIRTAKQSQEVKQKQHASKILDCSTYKQFWISWNHETIEVGEGGFIGQHTFMGWTSGAPLIPIQDGGFYTAFGSTGDWIFDIQDLVTTKETITCFCPCDQQGKYSGINTTNMSLEELRFVLRREMQHIKQAMSIDKKSSSKFIRTKTSAPDSRKSSCAMGVSAIFFIVIPLVFAVVCDCMNLYLQIQQVRENTNKGQI